MKTDPMPYILIAGFAGIFFGYLAGRLHPRQPHRRPSNRYGCITRTR